MSKEQIIQIFSESKSKSDVAKRLGYNPNGYGIGKVNELIDKYDIDTSILSINLKKFKTKYNSIKKKCPICGNDFETLEGHIREKTTCSHSCANTYFRSGVNNPNWCEDRYRSTCFYHHKKKCVVCDEERVLDVHHFDEDRSNNSPENLIPLCPTHHRYIHSKYKTEVIEKVINYRSIFLNDIINKN